MGENRVEVIRFESDWQVDWGFKNSVRTRADGNLMILVISFMEHNISKEQARR